MPGFAFNLSPRAKLEILFATLLALFMFALDQTVVGVALPQIVSDLGGNDLYTWSITIYLLTSTISGPIYGKLSDLFGRRPIFIWALSLFIVASVLAGLSQEMWQFILFRGLQGLAGGAVFPLGIRSAGRPLHAGRERQVRRLLRCRLRTVVHPRPGDWRDPHGHRRLAMDLLHQRAHSASSRCTWCTDCCRRSSIQKPRATSTTSERRSSPRPSHHS